MKNIFVLCKVDLDKNVGIIGILVSIPVSVDVASVHDHEPCHNTATYVSKLMRLSSLAICQAALPPPASSMPFMATATVPIRIMPIWIASVQTTAFRPPCVCGEELRKIHDKGCYNDACSNRFLKIQFKS